MILIPSNPIPFPVLVGPDDLVRPEAADERLAAVTIFQTSGPADQHVERGPKGQAFFTVDGPDGPVRCETKPRLTWVHIRGLGRRARGRLTDGVGPANILGEQVARRLKNNDEATERLRADAAALIDAFVGKDVMQQDGKPWRLSLAHDDDLDPGMARDSLVRQMAFAAALMVRLPGAFAARRRLEAAGADTGLLDQLLDPLTVDGLDDVERAAFDAHAARGGRVEDVMIAEALAAIEIGEHTFEGADALDVLDRAPMNVVEIMRGQIIGHVNRLSMSGKAQPPSGRQSG